MIKQLLSEIRRIYSSKAGDVSRSKKSNHSSIVLESHLPSRLKSTRREYDFNSSVVVVFSPCVSFISLIHFKSIVFLIVSACNKMRH